MAEALGLVTLHCAINDNTPVLDQPTPINGVSDLKRMFPEQFDRIGRFEGEAKLFLKPDAVPHKDRPRKVPIHLKPKIKEELDKMVDLGVIKKVDGHADWHNSLVCLLYTSPSPRDKRQSRMPSSA